MGDARGLVAGVGLGLALGLGAGYLLFGGRAPDPELAAAPEGMSPAAAAPGPASSDLGASGTERASTGERGDPGDADRSGADPTPDAAAPSDNTERAVAGTGEIHGRVTTEDGTPLADVVVRATLYGSEPDGDAWRIGDPAPVAEHLDAAGRRHAARLRRLQREQVEARTGSDGAYSLTRLMGGTHAVVAYREGYAIEPIGPRVNRHHGSRFLQPGGVPPGYVAWALPAVRVDFIARPIVAVPVALTLPDGSPPSRAWLSVSGTRQEHEWWTLADPVLRVLSGRYEITANAQFPNATDHDRREYRSDAVPLEVVVGRRTPPLSIALLERTVLAGRLDGLSPDPSQLAWVRALSLAEGGRSDASALMQSRHHAWVRGDQPVFRIENLEPGEYLVGVGLSGGGTPQNAHAVTLRPGLNVADFSVTGSVESAQLRVLAIGPDGRPLGDVQFWVTGGTRGQPHPIRVNRDADGAFVLGFASGSLDTTRAGEDDGAPPTPLRLHARSSLHGERSVVVSDARETVTVVFQAAAYLEVHAPGYRGSVLEGHCGISVWSPDELAGLDAEQPRRARRWGWQGYYTFDQDDRARIGPLSPGAYTAVLWVAPWGDRVSAGTAIEATRHPIALGSGTQVVTLALPLVHALTVVVEGASEGENVGLNPIDAGPDDNFRGETWIGVDAQGRGTIHGLPPGRYRLARQGPDGSEHSMAVTVPAAAPVRFAPDPRDRMRVTVVTEDGALGRAGLQSGDLIAALDGQPFRDPVQFARLLRASTAERVTLTVWRGGDVLTAPIERTALADGLVGGTGLGGTLTPAVGNE